MYRSTKENKGEYTIKSFIQRGLELTSVSEFNRFRKRYLPQIGGVKFYFYYLIITPLWYDMVLPFPISLSITFGKRRMLNVLNM